MSRFPQLLRLPRVAPMPVEPSIGRSTSAQAPRAVHIGALATVLAVLLGVGLGMRAPVAHAAAATTCTPQLLTSASHSAPFLQGTVTAKVYASYDARGHFCRAWGNATVHLRALAPPGNLSARLITIPCSGIDGPPLGSTFAGGGGNSGQTYTVNTGNTSTAPCGYAAAVFFFNGSNATTEVDTATVSFGGGI